MKTSVQQFKSGARASWGLYFANMRPVVLLGAVIPRVLFQSLFFILLAQAAGGSELAQFSLIGNAVHTAGFMAIIYMNNVIETEKWNQTLALIIASPSSWLPSMLGRSVANFTHAILSTMITLLVFVPIFAPSVAFHDILRSIPLLLLSLASISTLGWLVGAVALPVRYGELLGNLIGYSMMIVCGINFPLEALPDSVQVVSKLLPITNGILAIRAVIEGATYSSIFPLIGKEILIGLAFGFIAWQAFKYRLRVTRENGAFEVM